jgi:hypothetical protein
MFDAYKIGVTLSLTNHVSKGLMAMAGDFAKTEGQVTLLQKRINSIKNDALKGGLMIGAGVGMLALLKGPYEEAKKLAQAQADFQTLNLSGAENSEAFGKAASMSHKILGTTITENVKLVHDLHTAFGDLHHAIGTADMFSKMSIVAKVANGGAPVDGLVNAAAKALEHRGGKVINDPAAFEAEASLMTKVMLATKMRVTPKDYLTASGTGKMAYQLFDKEYLYGNFAGQMAINGGARTGTESMTAFSSLIGGHMDAKGKGFLADLGLWQEGFSKKRLAIMSEAMKGLSPAERKVAADSMGVQGAISGGLRDADAELYAHRPDLFIQKMIPLVRARFGMDLTDEQISLLVAKNLNRSTGNFLGTQITMQSKLSKDTAIINKSMGIGDAYQHYMKSPVGAEEAAHAAWKNFLAVFGTVYLPAITAGLLKLASGLDKLSQWVDRNQGLVKALVYTFAALAGALVMRGSILLLSAAFRGLGLALTLGTGLTLPASITAFGAAVAGLAAPVAIAVLAIGTIVAAMYAFRPLSKKEINDAKFEGGAKLTAGAAKRVAAGEVGFDLAKNAWYQFGPKFGSVVAASKATAAPKPAPWLPFGALPPSAQVAGGGPLVAKPIATPQQAGRAINNTIVMPDGRVLASVVTREQTKAASRPQTGSGAFNSDMTPTQPGTTR